MSIRDERAEQKHNMMKEKELHSGWMTMSQAAKLIGVMGRNKLYQFLREKSILMARNEPYQQYCDAGYFRMHLVPKYKRNGLFINQFPVLLVSEEGVNFITKLLAQSESEA